MNFFLFRSTILWTALALLRLFATPVDADAAEKINASYGAISGSMAPIWVAKEARLFDKQGLDLNLVYIPGGPRSIMSLIGNSIQFVNHSGMRWRRTSAARTRS
jgi:ABC-type nitrate/sulfonate/bicarbonate transport system substrate-binding protein